MTNPTEQQLVEAVAETTMLLEDALPSQHRQRREDQWAAICAYREATAKAEAKPECRPPVEHEGELWHWLEIDAAPGKVNLVVVAWMQGDECWLFVGDEGPKSPREIADCEYRWHSVAKPSPAVSAKIAHTDPSVWLVSYPGTNDRPTRYLDEREVLTVTASNAKRFDSEGECQAFIYEAGATHCIPTEHIFRSSGEAEAAAEVDEEAVCQGELPPAITNSFEAIRNSVEIANASVAHAADYYFRRGGTIPRQDGEAWGQLDLALKHRRACMGVGDKRVRLSDPFPPAPPISPTDEEIELAAQAIYDDFEPPENETKPAWQRRGNSHKQTEARIYAASALKALAKFSKPSVEWSDSDLTRIFNVARYGDERFFISEVRAIIEGKRV